MRFWRILLSCHQISGWWLGTGGWGAIMKRALTIIALVAAGTASLSADTLQGRWKLIAAEDIRADGSVARLPWGRHPVGSIVVEAGACMVQIMSGDTPSFTGAAPVNEQMKASLLSSYIAYSGPCTFNDAEGSVSLKVEAAWRPDYVGTDQKRMV